MRDVVIFSVDDWHSPYVLSKFLRDIDSLRANQKIDSNMKMLVGGYEGKLELSFILLKEDYLKYVHGTQYVANQQSVLTVKKDGGTTSTPDNEFLGHMEAIAPINIPDFSYRPDNNLWYQIKGS